MRPTTSRCCAYYNRLTFLDKNGEAQMELAESVESTDAKVWTVKLKQGRRRSTTARPSPPTTSSSR